jgi:hypothetical protein
VKLLRAELADDAVLLEVAMAEARVAGSLRHPNIAACTDLGVTRGKVPYVALE